MFPKYSVIKTTNKWSSCSFPVTLERTITRLTMDNKRRGQGSGIVANLTDRGKPQRTTYKLSTSKPLPDNTNCMACSDDGGFLTLGHSSGVSVWCVHTMRSMADWLQEETEVTSIKMTNVCEAFYMVGSVDNMGVMRIFLYHGKDLFLVSVLNSMQNINKRNVCLTFELFKGGDYGAASVRCMSDTWLEVYRFPSEDWIREFEAAAARKEEESESFVPETLKWSPVSVELKIFPPKIPPVRADDATKIITFCLSLDELDEGLRTCTHHFLLPCGSCPADVHVKSGLPAAVCMWWSGSHNLLQYFFHKSDQTTVDLKPDITWPHTNEITCSAVSRCFRFVAVGLSNAVVCVWDRLAGSPLSVSSIPTQTSLLRVQFVDYWPVCADDYQSTTLDENHLMALCKNGAIFSITVGRGAKSITTELPDKPQNKGDMPTITESVQFLRGLLLVWHRDGKILLEDVIHNTPLCALLRPASHHIASPCTPVYALNAKQHSLYIRGDPHQRRGCSAKKENHSVLLTFHFGESHVIKHYIASHPPSPPRMKKLSFEDLKEDFSFYLQERVLSVDERHAAIKHTWEHLQQRRENAAAPHK
ncbi:WD repeat-containing protein 93 isoform X2 [Synchiropus splendidus]|uniref:WD repeat-containing protein 93 isoform X2 n=1 Tax=Synchiropus splendidus TaxID=270530 RepID=UPI00237D8A46|nr:WD repeat-containing protein 93 isoform X2 [Synchiropus splendidus]